MRNVLTAIAAACGLLAACAALAFANRSIDLSPSIDPATREASRQLERQCTPLLSDTPEETRQREAPECGTGIASFRP